jgi:hypothetical protein
MSLLDIAMQQIDVMWIYSWNTTNRKERQIIQRKRKSIISQALLSKALQKIELPNSAFFMWELLRICTSANGLEKPLIFYLCVCLNLALGPAQVAT